MIYFIQDTHFDDENIILFEKRPFESAYQMNAILIRNWNDVVKNADDVYVSDFMNERQSDVDKKLKDLLSSLKGNKILIRGNHDEQSRERYLEAGFSQVYDYPVVLDDFYILSHEPKYVNMTSPYANIFGHVHANPMYETVSPRSFCVSAERIGYAPIEFQDVKQRILERN